MPSIAEPPPTRPIDMPSDVWSAFKDQSALEGLVTIGLTGALFAIARPRDISVRTAVTGPNPPVSSSLADAGTWLGNGVVLFPIMGIIYGSGWWAGDGTAREAGAMSLEALALGGIEAEFLKYAVQRERPDGSDHFSFPSGHATEVFAAASVVGSEFGWPAGVPAYAAAGFVGYSRLQKNKHWLSDVIAGSGLGILSGRAVCRVHLRRHAFQVNLGPAIVPGQAGATLAILF